MHLIYSTLALAEVAVLFVSAIAILYLVLRSVVRSFRKPGPEAKKPRAEDLRHLERAGRSGFY
ncbi:MAG: hypothetical protein ACK4UO_11945 [Pseudolabrys sp.]